MSDHCTDGPAYIEGRDPGDEAEPIDGVRVKCSNPRCDSWGCAKHDPECCHICGEPHWYNVWVPDDVWPRIMPDQDDPRVGGGGVLCARCIDRRCVETGLQDVRLRFHFTGKAVRSFDPEPETPAPSEVIGYVVTKKHPEDIRWCAGWLYETHEEAAEWAAQMRRVLPQNEYRVCQVLASPSGAAAPEHTCDGIVDCRVCGAGPGEREHAAAPQSEREGKASDFAHTPASSSQTCEQIPSGEQMSEREERLRAALEEVLDFYAPNGTTTRHPSAIARRALDGEGA